MTIKEAAAHYGVSTQAIYQRIAKAGKKNGYLIEGMGCPGGCIAGAGTNIPIANAQKCLAEFVKNSEKQLPPKELEKIELE